MNYQNYALGKWITGEGEGTPLYNAITGAEIGRASSKGLDFNEMLERISTTYRPVSPSICRISHDFNEI